MMRMLALCLALTGCATEGAEFQFPQSIPSPDDSKSDEPRVCGEESCVPLLCGYDCTTEGAECGRSCATEDGRAETFVAGSFGGGASFDTRTNPYAPVFSLDNVLVYGCEVWDYGNQEGDGLAIQYKELIHSTIAVNHDDPPRYKTDLQLYLEPLVGPGSYRASARYAAAHDAPLFYGRDACSVDIVADGSGLQGTFECSIPSQQGSSAVAVSGTFACAENAMRPIFSRWAAAPR